MKCKKCGGRLYVTVTRDYETCVKRFRKCELCGAKIVTIEEKIQH